MPNFLWVRVCFLALSFMSSLVLNSMTFFLFEELRSNYFPIGLNTIFFFIIAISNISFDVLVPLRQLRQVTGLSSDKSQDSRLPSNPVFLIIDNSGSSYFSLLPQRLILTGGCCNAILKLQL